MNTQMSPAVHKLGFWSALLAAVFSIAYVIGQVAEWLGLMGSGGGSENNSTWYGLVVLLVPSLFLGVSFVVMMVSVHHRAPADKKVWTHVALAFAGIYGAFICMNYFVQLTFVAPHLYHGDVTGDVAPFVFNVFDSFVYSVDLVGYIFMSLATLFAALAYRGRGLERVVRWFMIGNGLLVPFLALQNFYHPLLWVASLWGATLPGSAIALAVHFRRGAKADVREFSGRTTLQGQAAPEAA
jgi:hypothetical protein